MPTSPGGAESPNAHEQVQSFLFGEGGEPDPSVVDVVRQNPALLTEALGGDWGASPEVVRNLENF